MRQLAELQSTFGDIVLGGDVAQLENLIIADGIPASQRLALHRNNTTILLTDALAATFNVVSRLVGDEFFAYAARGFIRAHPPKSPALFEYGQEFAEYLEAMPETAQLPYLGDVARLEWLVNDAFHANDKKPLPIEGMVFIEEDYYSRLVLEPHPAFRIINSPYPIGQIYHANKNDVTSTNEYEIDLGSGGVCLAIMRPGVDVNFVEFDKTGFVLAKELAIGTPFNLAIEISQKYSPDFDPTATLAALLAGGAFSGFHISGEQNEIQPD